MSSESNTNRRTIKLYWAQVKKYKISFFFAFTLIPLAALLIDTALPYFLSQAIGGLNAQKQDAITQNIILASSIALVGVIFNLLGYQVMVRHEAKVRLGLASEAFEKLINKDLSFFINEKIGALTSRYIDFVASHMAFQDLLVIRTSSFLISIIAGLVIVGQQSLILAFILIILFILIIFQIKLNIKLRQPYRYARKNLIAESNGRVADSLTNSLIVKTFANEKAELKQLNYINEKIRDTHIKDLSIMSFSGSSRIFIMVTIQIIAIWFCATLVNDGQMSVSVAVFMLIYLQRIATQLFTIGEMINGYDKVLLSAAPLSDIIAQKIIINDKPNAIKLAKIKPTIELKNVSYQYEDNSEKVLKNIDIKIAAGEKIGLVGHSGAGKTTITHLLLRFSDVTSGAILIDGHDIRDVTQQSLRKNIAYVPQEPMLFHRSLRENIAYGKPDATDAEIYQAARRANALEFIEKLPKGLDTTVGERGIKLSGGQRQRIAIARAILKDAPILLLDEATSALDSESEKLIQDSLLDLMKGRTSIVIAHRLSTIAKLDRIIVIEDGKIIEDGTHTELLATNKTYAKLWKHQSGGFIEE
jgi:ATP-binding cassette subfamily B protein